MTPLPPLLLGLTGPHGAGKDSAARMLEDNFGFVRIAFSDPVLDMLCALAEHADVGSEWCTTHALKELPMPVLGRSYRTLARSLGTAWGRELLGEDWWVRIADHKLRQALHNGDNVVVTDVRHHNEAAWLASHGGRLLGVERDGYRHRPTEHDSEAQAAALTPWQSITTGSTCKALHDQLEQVVQALRQPEPNA